MGFGQGKKNQILIQRNNNLDRRALECQQLMQILSASHFLVPPSYSARPHQPVNTLQRPTHPHTASPAYPHHRRLCRGQACLPRAPWSADFLSPHRIPSYHPSVCKGVFGPFLVSHSVTWLRPHVYKIEQYIYANFGKLEKNLMFSHLEEDDV